MSNPTQDALEHLRVIRSLMERAHVYRALSAPAALLGGALALGTALWFLLGDTESLCGPVFLAVWLVILALSAVVNLGLLAWEAQRRGQPLFSDNMRTALRALTPPMLTGGVLGVGLVLARQELVLASLVWVLCYGLALLAAAGFSPRSLVWLGRLFLGVGLVWFGIWSWFGESWAWSPQQMAMLVMGATFGLLHLGYGATVFLAGSRAPARE